jgi:orotidine-5'-phosphate decarboxylase
MPKKFHRNYGVIPACDVETLEEFKALVDATADVEGVVAYKIGCILGLTYGLPELVKAAKQYSDLPIIFDHQKAGTDIPQLGDKFAEVCKVAGVDGVILFPQAGPETEMAFIKAVMDRGLIAIIGGEMTHAGYLAKDGGFIRDDAPQNMYEVGAKAGVEHFVVPGNKQEIIEKYVSYLSTVIEFPKFLMPGIGRQGGDIATAFAGTGGQSAYAIIGSGIYQQKDMKTAAQKFGEIVMKFERG